MNTPRYEVTRLDNGVTIATAAMPHMESACIGLWALTGSRHEEPKRNGIAHFVEHLLFKGTPTRTAYEISRQIEGIGASLDAFTTEDHTCYYTRGPAVDPARDGGCPHRHLSATPPSIPRRSNGNAKWSLRRSP